MFNGYFEPPMNTLSINNDPVQGISVEGSRLTLPSGECKLNFSVYISDGTPVVNKKVGLAFINSITHKVVDLPLVQDDKSHWGGSAVLPADASAQVQFSLKVLVPLPENLKLRAILQDEPSYQDGTNTLTFSLTEHIIDHNSEVDSLVMISGDKQFVTMDGDNFQPLIVQACHGTTPVTNAVISFNVSPPATASLRGRPAPTDANGTTGVLLTKGAQPGGFTVTASAGTATPVIFHLALGPQSTQLELKLERTEVSLHVRNDDTGVLNAHVFTRGTTIGWPYIRGSAEVSASDVIMLRQGIPGGERPSINLISDDSGGLHPVTGNENLTVIPKRTGNASVRIDAFISPSSPVHEEVKILVRGG